MDSDSRAPAVVAVARDDRHRFSKPLRDEIVLVADLPGLAADGSPRPDARLGQLERARVRADVRVVLREEVQRPEVRRWWLRGVGRGLLLRLQLGVVPLGDGRDDGELVRVTVQRLDICKQRGDVSLQSGGDVGFCELLELVACVRALSEISNAYQISEQTCSNGQR